MWYMTLQTSPSKFKLLQSKPEKVTADYKIKQLSQPK